MRRKTRQAKVLRIRAVRRSREMTQAELGRRVGLTAHFICEIEKGKRKPSLDKAQAIAAVLGITVDEAFEHVDVPSSAAVAS